MNYYKHNIGDYRRDTAHLSLIEHGIYRQMLDQYYLDEKPLIADKEKLMRSLCVRNADELRAAENVLNDFFKLTKKGYEHIRCERELEAIYAKSEKARQSAKSRWSDKNQQVKEDDNANASETHTKRNANGMLPTTHNPLPTTYNLRPITQEKDKNPVPAKKPQEPVTSDNESLIFDFWKITMDHPRAKLDKKRKSFIKAALKTGYTVDECKMAILGCSKTPHNIGENDRNQVYDGLHIILKDADNIDRFIGNYENPPKQQSDGPIMKPLGDGNGYEQRDTRSRAQKVSDKLDQIAREDIEQRGFAETLG